MRKPLLIGNSVFSTKKAALGCYKAILNSYNFGESLSDDDYIKVFDLIKYAIFLICLNLLINLFIRFEN